MASWKPRRPSARLERELFGEADSIPHRARPGAFGVSWLVPATGTLLVLFVTLVRLNGPAFSDESADLAGYSKAVSNVTLAAFAAGDSLSRHNAFLGRKIGWTTDAAFPSSMPPSSRLGTNSLKR